MRELSRSEQWRELSQSKHWRELSRSDHTQAIADQWRQLSVKLQQWSKQWRSDNTTAHEMATERTMATMEE